ncbi:MAG: TAXI family TRAP transporter solute-binding subunit [Gammaproteobacteria bacterium]|nr:TAXI family TRAP transporter solute-binding subunit [Gammaproteobacteria bacterium]
MTRFVVSGVLLFGCAMSAMGAAEITIGTGSSEGIYYQAGRAMCRLVNATTDDHGIICAPKTSEGSISNLEQIRDGGLEIGLAQSDWQFHAYKGSSKFGAAGPDTNLRSLFALHGEPFTVVARADSGIRTFDDLRGKRVNLGNPGSGQHATMDVVMAAKGWDKSVFSLANELPASQQAMALCQNRIQAMIYTVGHPNPSVAHAASACNSRIVEVRGPEIDRLVDDNPFYAYTEVPGGLYAGNPEAVTTFGVKATVVVSSTLDTDTVYQVVKAVFDQFERLRAMHPAFANLDPAKMLSEGLTAPLHEGARRYYIERGWITE